MQSALYVSLSAQVTLEKRLETIANNMANMKTSGFRADAVKFDTMLSRLSELKPVGLLNWLVLRPNRLPPGRQRGSGAVCAPLMLPGTWPRLTVPAASRAPSWCG